jgi:DNA-binding NtrC family response regulator
MAKGETPTHTQATHTLLVVDDERSLRFSIGEWARDMGFAALEAASGAEALEHVKEQSVDVVLLDLKLNTEDGMDVLRRLREEDPALPVLMLTGHGSVEHAVQATKLGAYDFLQKPPNLDHLGVLVTRRSSTRGSSARCSTCARAASATPRSSARARRCAACSSGSTRRAGAAPRRC